MYKLLSNEREIVDFLSTVENDPLGARMETDLKTYGLNSYPRFYYGSNCVRLCFFDGVLSVSVSKGKSDIDELKEFAEFTGAAEIEISSYSDISKEISECFSEDKYSVSEAVLLKYNKDRGENIKFQKHLPKNFSVSPLYSDDLYSFFNLSYPGEKPDFPLWYTDLSHKLRHGFVHGVKITADDKIVSSAATSGESGKAALISAVTTDIDFRHSGLGSECVLTLVKSLNQKFIYVITKSPITSKWYEKLGFEKSGNRFYTVSHL